MNLYQYKSPSVTSLRCDLYSTPIIQVTHFPGAQFIVLILNQDHAFADHQLQFLGEMMKAYLTS